MYDKMHSIFLRKPVPFPPGVCILVTEGEGSDYQAIAVLWLKRSCSNLELLRLWEAQCEPHLRSGAVFAAFLVCAGYAEEMAFYEMNITDELEA